MCKFVNNTKHSRIDRCMKNLIENLNIIKQKRFVILGCCCGHKKYKMSIIIQCKGRLESNRIYDLVSGVEIPRKRNFYKKDKDGFYYIPEVLNEQKS